MPFKDESTVRRDDGSAVYRMSANRVGQGFFCAASFVDAGMNLDWKIFDGLELWKYGDAAQSKIITLAFDANALECPVAAEQAKTLVVPQRPMIPPPGVSEPLEVFQSALPLVLEAGQARPRAPWFGETERARSRPHFSVRLEIPTGCNADEDLFSEDRWRLWTWGAHGSTRDEQRTWPDGEAPARRTGDDGKLYLQWSYGEAQAPSSAGKGTDHHDNLYTTRPLGSEVEKGLYSVRVGAWHATGGPVAQSDFYFVLVFFDAVRGPQKIFECRKGLANWRDKENFTLRWSGILMRKRSRTSGNRRTSMPAQRVWVTQCSPAASPAVP